MEQQEDRIFRAAYLSEQFNYRGEVCLCNLP